MELKSCKLLPTESDFNFWITNKLNVLFVGGPGVGKTTMIVDAFSRFNLKFRYFSASTMDPWVDFIGIPQEQTDEKGKYLDLIKMKEFRDDEVEAIFFDEYNRAPKKVRNAVMELIQFKSINGKKFNNLKMIWGAINPYDDEHTFDVEKLDPAQMDRFQVQIELPHEPNGKYFVGKFGPSQAKVAIDWWSKLPKDVQINVTPRRLEVALNIHNLGGNIAHVLPSNSTFSVLKTHLNDGSPKEKLLNYIAKKDKEAVAKLLINAKNFDFLMPEIKKNLEYVFDCLPQERQSSLLTADDDKAWKVVAADPVPYRKVVEALTKSPNKKVSGKASDILKKIKAKETFLNPVATVETGDNLNFEAIKLNTKTPLCSGTTSRFWITSSYVLSYIPPGDVPPDLDATATKYDYFNIDYCEKEMTELLTLPYATPKYVKFLDKLIRNIKRYGFEKNKTANYLNIFNCIFGRLQSSTLEKFTSLKPILICLGRANNVQNSIISDSIEFLSIYPNIAKFDLVKMGVIRLT